MVVVGAAVGGLLVGVQLRGMGLRDPDDGIRWSRVIGGLSGWLLLLAGLGGTTHFTGLGLLSGLLLEGFAVLLPLLPASIVLATASTWARARRLEPDPSAATEARWGTMAAGGVAALIAAQAEAFWTLLLLGVVGAALWLTIDPKARARATDGWNQLQAGVRLRQILGPDTVLQRDGREVLLAGPIGLLATEVLVDGQAQILPNRELLVLMPAGVVPR